MPRPSHVRRCRRSRTRASSNGTTPNGSSPKARCPAWKSMLIAISPGSCTRVRPGATRESWCGSRRLQRNAGSIRFSPAINGMAAAWRCGSLRRPRQTRCQCCFARDGYAVRSTFRRWSGLSRTSYPGVHLPPVWKSAGWSIWRNTKRHHTRPSARSRRHFANRPLSACGRRYPTIPDGRRVCGLVEGKARRRDRDIPRLRERRIHGLTVIDGFEGKGIGSARIEHACGCRPKPREDHGPSGLH